MQAPLRSRSRPLVSPALPHHGVTRHALWGTPWHTSWHNPRHGPWHTLWHSPWQTPWHTPLTHASRAHSVAPGRHPCAAGKPSPVRGSPFPSQPLTIAGQLGAAGSDSSQSPSLPGQGCPCTPWQCTHVHTRVSHAPCWRSIQEPGTCLQPDGMEKTQDQTPSSAHVHVRARTHARGDVKSPCPRGKRVPRSRSTAWGGGWQPQPPPSSPGLVLQPTSEMET